MNFKCENCNFTISNTYYDNHFKEHITMCEDCRW